MSRIPRIAPAPSSPYPDNFEDTHADAPPQHATVMMTCGWSRLDGLGDERTGPFSFGGGLSADDSRNLMLALSTQGGVRARAEVVHVAFGLPVVRAWAEMFDDAPPPTAHTLHRMVDEHGLVYEVCGPAAAVELLRRSGHEALRQVAQDTLASALRALGAEVEK